jgi:regulatory protein YycI of two-component signal transduction system YycFG
MKTETIFKVIIVILLFAVVLAITSCNQLAGKAIIKGKNNTLRIGNSRLIHKQMNKDKSLGYPTK